MLGCGHRLARPDGRLSRDWPSTTACSWREGRSVSSTAHQTYDPNQTYAWNYAHAPAVSRCTSPAIAIPGEWTYAGRPVPSPLAVAAGPLLNGRWVLHYAALGFDVLTYKTVRSRARECYPLPNLVPVRTEMMVGGESDLLAMDEMSGSWAVSFGMPSAEPEVWREDIRWTRSQLPREKLLSVSVVGTAEYHPTFEELVHDYARCAEWAVDAGADCVELNLSCPNVQTCDGQLYQQPSLAGALAREVRSTIGSDVPLILKIGYLDDDRLLEPFVEQVAPFADALATTNSVASTVNSSDGTPLFDGQRRGICGAATREVSCSQVRRLANAIRSLGVSLKIIGVGGIATAEDVQAYLAAGAESVQIATAAMRDPLVAQKIRTTWDRLPGEKRRRDALASGQ